MNNIINFYTKKYDSGIVMCVATTSERWVHFDNISHNKELSTITFIMLNYKTDHPTEFYESPNVQTFDLDLDKNMQYLKLEQIVKEDVCIYFIPHDLLDKEKWLKKQQLKIQK